MTKDERHTLRGICNEICVPYTQVTEVFKRIHDRVLNEDARIITVDIGTFYCSSRSPTTKTLNGKTFDVAGYNVVRLSGGARSTSSSHEPLSTNIVFVGFFSFNEIGTGITRNVQFVPQGNSGQFQLWIDGTNMGFSTSGLQSIGPGGTIIEARLFSALITEPRKDLFIINGEEKATPQILTSVVVGENTFNQGIDLFTDPISFNLTAPPSISRDDGSGGTINYSRDVVISIRYQNAIPEN